MPRSKPKVPDADEKHVEESCWEDKFRKTDENEVEDVDKDRCNRVLPLANFSEPSIQRDDARE